MSDLLGFESLDALVDQGLKQAKAAAARAKPRAHGARPAGTASIKPQDKYANPANWVETRGIALIHEESKTLLGNFREFLHLTEKGARRLIREEAPLKIDAQEYVTGTWGWVEPPMDRSEHAPPVIVELLRLHIALTSPRVAAETAILVHKQGAGILRIELLDETLFSDLGQSFLSLPSGTNLLPVLTQETKLAIYANLRTQEIPHES